MRCCFFLTTLCILIFFTGVSSAQQVVHIENKRLLAEKDGWSGNIDFEGVWTRNQSRIFHGTNSLGAEYTIGKNVFLFLNELELMRVNGDNVISDGFQHLRYNYRISRLLTWEAFVQSQFNEPYRIAFRGLAGTGPRFRIFQTEKMMLFLGSLYMYEAQRFVDAEEYRLSHRISSYLSYTVKPYEDLTFNLITYYQPNIADPTFDYRVSGEATADFAFREWLSFVIGYSFFYDNIPAEGVPNEFHSITNGIRLSF